MWHALEMLSNCFGRPIPSSYSALISHRTQSILQRRSVHFIAGDAGAQRNFTEVLQWGSARRIPNPSAIRQLKTCFSRWARRPADVFKAVPFTAKKVAGRDARSRQIYARDRLSVSKYFVSTALVLFTEETPNWLYLSTLLCFRHLKEMTVSLWD